LAALDRDLELVALEERSGSHPNHLILRKFPLAAEFQGDHALLGFENNLRLATLAHAPQGVVKKVQNGSNREIGSTPWHCHQDPFTVTSGCYGRLRSAGG
jgi:hypothetical protein